MPNLTITSPLCVGDVAELSLGTYDAVDVVIKTATQIADNDLIYNETSTLTQLTPAPCPPGSVPDLEDIEKMKFRAYLPSIVTTGVDSQGREYNVQKRLDGFYPLSEIVANMGPLDVKDLAWIWRRVLTAIGFAHNQGFVHAAVYPEHIMIHPGDHGVVLVDWCYARPIGTPAHAYISRYHDSLPREILRKRGLTASTDVKMATEAMLFAVDDATFPPVLRSFSDACMRMDDAWHCKDKFDGLIERLWGKRTFRAMTYVPKGP